MHRIRTDQVSAHLGERVKMAGWMHNLRLMGKLGFLILRDGAGVFQAVVDDPAELEKLKGLQFESVLEIEGVVTPEPRAVAGAELHDCRLTVLSPVVEPLPFEINKKELKPGLGVFLDHAPLGLRHPQKRALFRISAEIMAGFREYLNQQGFVEVQTPKIVGSATESGANVFRIDYFGRPAYLAQSPQFYKQMMVGVFERVFEVGPVFRAEKHATTRHTNEYVSLDIEMGFVQDHRDVMAMLTGVMRHMCERVARARAQEVELLKMKVPTVGETIPSLRMPDAQQLIFERYGEDCRGEPDLAPQHEVWLCQYAEQELGSEFLFITHYPTSKRPFYTMPDDQDPALTKGFDLLFRGCEIVTGGQRIHHYAQLVDNARKWGIDPEAIEGYLQAFKYGMPPHGGFAIGLERLLMQLAGLSNLRETTLFPRDLTRLSP
ncbi:MAG: aspartate--tRNA(Asn) ligase [Chloroflexi bacterium]|nr:aspartate--tRNA(Asn) ligase [Chloroflexota bacterium]